MSILKQLPVLVVGLLLVCRFQGFAEDNPNQLFLGSWRLLSWESRAGDGTVTHPFGDKPVGILMYNSDGRMCAQLMRPDRPQFQSKDFLKGTPNEIRTAFEGFIGYFGRFTVDASAKTVTHHVEGSSFPNYVGSNLTRSFSFAGNRLTLRTEPFPLGKQSGAGVLVWERIEPVK